MSLRRTLLATALLLPGAAAALPSASLVDGRRPGPTEPQLRVEYADAAGAVELAGGEA